MSRVFQLNPGPPGPQFVSIPVSAVCLLDPVGVSPVCQELDAPKIIRQNTGVLVLIWGFIGFDPHGFCGCQSFQSVCALLTCYLLGVCVCACVCLGANFLRPVWVYRCVDLLFLSNFGLTVSSTSRREHAQGTAHSLVAMINYLEPIVEGCPLPFQFTAMQTYRKVLNAITHRSNSSHASHQTPFVFKDISTLQAFVDRGGKFLYIGGKPWQLFDNMQQSQSVNAILHSDPPSYMSILRTMFGASSSRVCRCLCCLLPGCVGFYQILNTKLQFIVNYFPLV